MLTRRDDLFGSSPSSDLWCNLLALHVLTEARFSRQVADDLGLHINTARQVQRLQSQYMDIARGLQMDLTDAGSTPDALTRCLLAGFPDNVGRRLSSASSRCRLVGGRSGTIARESPARDSALFVAAGITEIGTRGGEVDVTVDTVSAVQIDWLREQFPDDLSESVEVEHDAGLGRLRRIRQIRFRDLTVLEEAEGDPGDDEIARFYAKEILEKRIMLKSWSASTDSWIARVNLIARICPELGIAPIDHEALLPILEQLCHGTTRRKEIRQLDIQPELEGWLTREQAAALPQLAPEKVRLSNGIHARIHYPSEGEPYIARTVQDLYDVSVIPTIAMGRISPLIHVLAPNQRVAQITADLAGFWNDSYEQLKKDLKGRYPKHEWR